MKKQISVVLLLGFHAVLIAACLKQTEKPRQVPVIGYTATQEVTLWPDKCLIEVAPITEGDFEPWSEEVAIGKADGIWFGILQDGRTFNIDPETMKCTTE